MKSYPFTSKKITYDEQGLPVYDRAVDSAFLRKVFSNYFSDGVFYKPANALQVVADTGMQVVVEPGVCHIRGAMGIEESRRTMVVQAAEEMDRIDTVVARLDLSVDVRSVDLYVIKGTAAESPQPPALTRDSTKWEIGLANLFVAKNVSTITQQRITDTRLDNERCGVVAQTIGDLDTAPYFAQLAAAIAQHQTDAQAQIAALQSAIEAVEGDSAWMMTELYDPDALHKDLGVQLYTHSKEGTVHNFVGSGTNGRAKITAAFNDGDTVQLNGTPVTATCGADPVDEDTIVVDKWVTFVADEEGGQLNFKGGGGLGRSKLAKATAQADEVFHGKTYYAGDKTLKTGTLSIDTATATASYVSSGKTFYAGDKTRKTGTLVERGQYQNAGGIGAGGDSTYYAFNNIPEGIYRKNGASWAPEIRYSKGPTLDYILKATAISVQWKALAYNSGRLQTNFSVKTDKVYLAVAQASAMDGNMAYTEMSLPVNKAQYVFHQQDYTQDHVYMNTSIKVCVFKAMANGTCYAAGTGNGDRAVAFVGIWQLVP